MFGSAGIFARLVEIMKHQLTEEQTMRYATGEGWLAHKYVFSLSDPTLNGLDHETVDLSSSSVWCEPISTGCQTSRSGVCSPMVRRTSTTTCNCNSSN
jgi:hypothetical protein